MGSQWCPPPGAVGQNPQEADGDAVECTGGLLRHALGVNLRRREGKEVGRAEGEVG